MVHHGVLDSYLYNRIAAAGATIINGLFLKIDLHDSKTMLYVLHYTDYNAKSGSTNTKKTLEVNVILGADGTNSRIMKCIGIGDYKYTIVF